LIGTFCAFGSIGLLPSLLSVGFAPFAAEANHFFKSGIVAEDAGALFPRRPRCQGGISSRLLLEPGNSGL
jgi:hypothetical protein